MNFDLISMKKRSTTLMKGKWNLYIVSFILTVLQIFGVALIIRTMNSHVKLLLPVYIVVIILVELFRLGFISSMIKRAEEKEVSFIELFAGFYKNPIKALLSILLKQIILFVGFLLLYVPGLIAFYRLRFFYYELMDEEKSIGKCLKDSMDLMKGNCIELFKIDLSFIGWYLLNLITLGISSVYVKPFTTITYVEYYKYLKGKKEMFSGK